MAEPHRIGDIVWARRRHGVVWHIERHEAFLLLVLPRQTPHHRADVPVHDAAEVRAMGCGSGPLVIRAGVGFWLPEGVGDRVGVLSRAARGRVAAAVELHRPSEAREREHADTAWARAMMREMAGARV